MYLVATVIDLVFSLLLIRFEFTKRGGLMVRARKLFLGSRGSSIIRIYLSSLFSFKFNL